MIDVPVDEIFVFAAYGKKREIDDLVNKALVA